MIQISHISKSFDKQCVLNDISLRIPRGYHPAGYDSIWTGQSLLPHADVLWCGTAQTHHAAGSRLHGYPAMVRRTAAVHRVAVCHQHPQPEEIPQTLITYARKS